jgi:surface protein
LVKTGMFGYAASLNGDVSSWDVSGVAFIHGFFGFATPFGSEVGSWGDAGATVNNERHDHVTWRYSTAKSARRMPQVKLFVMTGTFG